MLDHVSPAVVIVADGPINDKPVFVSYRGHGSFIVPSHQFTDYKIVLRSLCKEGGFYRLILNTLSSAPGTRKVELFAE